MKSLNINRIFSILAAAAVIFPTSAAKEVPTSRLPDGCISDVSVERSASNLLVSMTIHPGLFDKKANREVWIRPFIIGGNDTLRLIPVVVAGRTRYYRNLRADGETDEYIMVRSGSGDPFHYSVNVSYLPYMERGELQIESHIKGCCGDDLAAVYTSGLESFDFREKILRPAYSYVKPTGEIEKTRTVKGEAYIDFPVNKTTIYPGYRRNPQELAEIRKTIDAVRNDKDVTITSLTIKGYASPEGPYNINGKLAKGRTEALVKYVGDLYDFPESVLHADWEAEDWDGLAARIRKSNISEKDAILAVVTDNSMEPDARDAMLKRNFPEQYAFILTEIYPALRHSDYNVTYVVRDFTDVAEIAEVMKTDPRKLSLEELFLYARSLDKDSPEFREVMEVAVRMYPDDPVANLNAATTAVDHGEYDKARGYLRKAGNSPEATYTAGVLEAKTGNYDKAKQLLETASKAGIADADTLLSNMRDWGWID